jgi:hypothetical protein
MSITKCPRCGRLCFSDALSGHSCAVAFQAGELSANVAAEEEAFNRKWDLIFIAALAVLLAALVFVGLRRTREADLLAPQSLMGESPQAL